MGSNSVLPIIVLYKPDDSDLRALINSLMGQVERVCIVDNSDFDNSEIISIMCTDFGIDFYYKPLLENVGIAKAQNIGINIAKEHNYDYVLLLDQDSALPGKMVSSLVCAYKNLQAQGVNVGAIGPAFLDIKSNELCGAVITKWFRVERPKVDLNVVIPVKSDYIIASGSLIEVATLNIVGLMRENLFIDWVDIEWGERANRHGFHSFIVPSIVMRHSIGDSLVRAFGRDVNLHSEFRNYFIIRNSVNLLFCGSFTIKNKLLMVAKPVWYTILYTRLSDNKLRSFMLYSKAIFDGLTFNMGKGHFR